MAPSNSLPTVASRQLVKVLRPADPIEPAVVDEPLLLQQAGEHLAEARVVRLVGEVEAAHVGVEYFELLWEAEEEIGGGRRLLFVNEVPRLAYG